MLCQYIAQCRRRAVENSSGVCSVVTRLFCYRLDNMTVGLKMNSSEVRIMPSMVDNKCEHDITDTERVAQYHSTRVLQYSSTSCHVQELSEHAATVFLLLEILKSSTQ